jgi:hypothetical protein
VSVAADSPELRLELTCDDEPVVYCAECWEREFGDSDGTRPESYPPSAAQRDLAESESVAGSVSPCRSEEERHARSQGNQPCLPLLAVRHALGLRTLLAGICCQRA